MSERNETDIMRIIMIALTKAGCRIFRNNTGSAWIGKSTMITKPTTVNLLPGDVVIKNARFFNAGLCKGSSDLIGISQKEITPDMVGKKVGLFAAVEVKKKNGKASDEQIAFINMVNNFGGIGFIAKSDEEAIELLNKKS